MVITWLDIEEIQLKTVILANFLFSRSNTILAISHEWLVRLIQYRTLTFDLTHDIDLGCFKVKFRKSSLSGIVGLIDVKWKGSELIWYWANYMTLPFDHAHGLDLGISRSESEIALSQEWVGQLTMNEKDVSHPFVTMILTCLTMVSWTDVPDSDWGDFRRPCAVYLSNWLWFVVVWFWWSLAIFISVSSQATNEHIVPMEIWMKYL